MSNQVKEQATSNQSLGMAPGKVTGPPAVRGLCSGSFPSSPSPMATGSRLASQRSMAWSLGTQRKESSQSTHEIHAIYLAGTHPVTGSEVTKAGLMEWVQAQYIPPNGNITLCSNMGQFTFQRKPVLQLLHTVKAHL